ncbi:MULTISPECIES: posphoenolpyruvate synthetase regulatory kinase/phosphorylase PpsR [Pseudomonadaceae]|jgi:regulator of PEP synthase PpsR (kinase-PPPase family)|uniref:Putative phosphoenolpyruvate synthase regulatory protein n=1 Tax=Pseudomonas saudiphocaensis TaxID=1499686 RepID=A0A078LM04_9PSED|nr:MULTISPECIES: pyruvate, water dikinase regulatory protein [Pseudomonadaceae]MBE7926493.1 kinase/pyrophosphorylase [Pseudomonas saudiphocaensis]MCF6782551.1 kinase/pyrophosphorylase [Stutzerimonas stutzeri]MCF6805656.1 kinase/pyrophosphorylase [Stutzerimonas stutzeri]RRV15880.1 kinase/pyrophosphorylase [Pseudomonas saudiphocaensis]CDZ93613.1 phosphoenolpyruvate synthetase regulatory protein [Pseudomonas saudiphocaensis]
MKRTAFFISDGTGITAETLGQSLLAQFETINFTKLTRPYIDTTEKARAMVQQINKAAESDGVRPIIFDTLVNQGIRDILAESNGFMIDIFSSFLSPLEHELNSRSSYSVGKSHSIGHSNNYMERIEAVNFALDNDDGARTRHYDKADLILVGVSRCGKTPTCLYMAMQYGIRAANYPLTEDDMERLQLPTSLKAYKDKLFGLTIDPERLAAIRNERKPNSRYSSFAQCEFEVREVESLFRRENINFINSTHFSVEEISAKILVEKGVERRFK